MIDPYANLQHNTLALASWLGLPDDTEFTWQTIDQHGADANGLPIDGASVTFGSTAAGLPRAASRRCSTADYPNLYFTWGLFDPPDQRVVANCTRVLALVLDCDACDWMEARGIESEAWDADVVTPDMPDDDLRYQDKLRAAKIKAVKSYLWESPAVEFDDLLDDHLAVLQARLGDLGLQPSSIIRSGYGHYAIFRLSDGGTDIDQCREINRRLVHQLNELAGFELADFACIDAGTRILRMIGAYNVKNPTMPRRCYAILTDGPAHDLADLLQLLPAPATPEQAASVAPPSAPVETDDDRLTDVDKIHRALEVLEPDCDYDDWLRVGMICYHAGLDIAVWDAWSRGGSKYQEGCCEKRWHGFGRGQNPVAVGTLVEMVRKVRPDFLKPGYRRDEFAQRDAQLPRAQRRNDAPADAQVPPAELAATLAAEASVLGCILFRGIDVFAIVDDLVDADHFFDDRHRAVWKACYALASSGTKIDPITVGSRMAELGCPEGSNDPVYLEGLMTIAHDASALVAADNVVPHAEIVRKAGCSRKLGRLSAKLTADLASPGIDNIAALDNFVAAAADVTADKSARGHYHDRDFFATWIEMSRSRERRVKTSMKLINENLRGGWWAPHLHGLLARPKAGKSALVCGWVADAADDVAKHGKGEKIGVLSMEMPFDQNMARMVAHRDGLWYSNLENGPNYLMAKALDDEYQKARETANFFEQHLIIQDGGGLSLTQFQTTCQRMVEYDGAIVLFVDLINNLRVPGDKENERLTRAVEETSQLARRLNVPIVGVMQLNREGAGENATLDNVYGTDALYRECFWAAILHRDRKPAPEGIVRAKLKIGGIRGGQETTIDLVGNNLTMHWEEAAVQGQREKDGAPVLKFERPAHHADNDSLIDDERFAAN